MKGLAKIVDTVLGVMAAEALDDAALEEGKIVLLDEFHRLDCEVLVVATIDLDIEWRGGLELINLYHWKLL